MTWSFIDYSLFIPLSETTAKAEKKKEVPVPKASILVADMTEEEKKKAQEENDLAHTTELFGK